MRISLIRPLNNSERYVRFSDVIEVRHFNPEESFSIQPSLHAKRIEKQLRIAPCISVKPSNLNVKLPNIPKQSLPVKTCKNVLYTAGLICGALVIPSFICLIFGPIGLAIPALLAVACFGFFVLAGEPTFEMQKILESNRKTAKEWDSCF